MEDEEALVLRSDVTALKPPFPPAKFSPEPAENMCECFLSSFLRPSFHNCF